MALAFDLDTARADRAVADSDEADKTFGLLERQAALTEPTQTRTHPNTNRIAPPGPQA